MKKAVLGLFVAALLASCACGAEVEKKDRPRRHGRLDVRLHGPERQGRAGRFRGRRVERDRQEERLESRVRADALFEPPGNDRRRPPGHGRQHAGAHRKTQRDLQLQRPLSLRRAEPHVASRDRSEDVQRSRRVDDWHGGPGSVDEEFIDRIEKENNVKIKRVYFDDTAMQDVVMGKIDACVQSQTIAIEAIQRFGADKIKVLIGGGLYFESAYPFAKTPQGDALR